MGIQNVIDNFNLELFRARIHYNLRHNNINPENWEKAIAEAVSGTWVKGSKYLADGFHAKEKVILTIKTRNINPSILTRKESRDFISHPEHFHYGGKEFNEGDLDNIHTVSGRCSIPGLNEQSSTPEEIGKASLNRYYTFENDSLKKFNCDNTLDIVVLHGKSRTEKNYLLRVMFFNHQLNNIDQWHDIIFNGPRTKYHGHRSMVLGRDNNGPHIGRISNLGRQQTCMLRFYRKSEALHIIETSVPIPHHEKFNFANEVLMMNK